MVWNRYRGPWPRAFPPRSPKARDRGHPHLGLESLPGTVATRHPHLGLESLPGTVATRLCWKPSLGPGPPAKRCGAHAPPGVFVLDKAFDLNRGAPIHFGVVRFGNPPEYSCFSLGIRATRHHRKRSLPVRGYGVFRGALSLRIESQPIFLPSSSIESGGNPVPRLTFCPKVRRLG